MCVVTASIGCIFLFTGLMFGTLTPPNSLVTSFLLNIPALNTGGTDLVVSGMVLILKSQRIVASYLSITCIVGTRRSSSRDMQFNHHMLFFVISAFKK